MKTILLFAHGARDSRWALPFEKLLADLRIKQPNQVFELAYLEFMSPNLKQGLDSLIQQGSTEILLVPLFMSSGGHVKKDVVELINQARLDNPYLQIDIAEAIGENDLIIQAMSTVVQNYLS